MKKCLILILLVKISLIINGQIIADHTVVDLFDEIPQRWIDSVKTMLFIPAGESHSNGYLGGLRLLEEQDAKYSVDFGDGVGGPDTYTNTRLRAERVMWGDYENESGWITMYGEEDWFTNSSAIERTKAGITYMTENGWNIGAIGFVWCWDMYGASSTQVDPEYNVHWFGTSVGGPDGAIPWGLNSGDFSITGNSVSLDTYLNTTEQYQNYCIANGYDTKVFYVTGPNDLNYANSEERYQAYIKYEYIRDFVKNNPSRILYDYADILSYDDDGYLSTETWNDITYPIGTPTNTYPEETGHISNAGALRLGKALWWMLARIAGWDGGTASSPVRVESISIEGTGGATTIDTDKGTLQLSAIITPDNATNKSVTWSISNGTNYASIDALGVVSAIENGVVTTRATANDSTGVYGELQITISDQVIPVSGISISGVDVISTIGGTAQLTAIVSPSDATNQSVSWSIINGSGTSALSESGLVTALANGVVTIRATAQDGSGVYGEKEITISNQSPPVTGDQIIADHTIVDRYDDIPPYYIAEVKRMVLSILGETHANGYFGGFAQLESLDPTYDSDIEDGVDAPDPPSESKLNIHRVSWGDYTNETGWIRSYGEEDWFTNPTAIARTKTSISYMNTNGYEIGALGFAWGWDMLGDVSPLIDPEYGIRWLGVAQGSPEGVHSWGLDDEDSVLTGNSVSMDSYLNATQEYIDYCISNGYPTKVFFTTGPIDSGSEEELYQIFLKHEHIRNYVNSDPSRILFDYADILSYDDDGILTTITWSDHTFPALTAVNGFPSGSSQISNAGALRLGKALWWMLARIAGWDGSSLESQKSLMLVNSINESTEGSDEIKIYPNPSSGLVNLYWSNLNIEGLTLTIYDLAGKPVRKIQIEPEIAEFQINIENLERGMYLFELKVPGMNRVIKLRKVLKY